MTKAAYWPQRNNLGKKMAYGWLRKQIVENRWKRSGGIVDWAGSLNATFILCSKNSRNLNFYVYNPLVEIMIDYFMLWLPKAIGKLIKLIMIFKHFD